MIIGGVSVVSMQNSDILNQLLQAWVFPLETVRVPATSLGVVQESSVTHGKPSAI